MKISGFGGIQVQQNCDSDSRASDLGHWWVPTSLIHRRRNGTSGHETPLATKLAAEPGLELGPAFSMNRMLGAHI